MAHHQRVGKALQTILASRSWTTPQRQWLQRIANQTKAITIVDREALDDDALLFRREGGGWPRLNKLFGGELEQVQHRFNEALWALMKPCGRSEAAGWLPLGNGLDPRLLLPQQPHPTRPGAPGGVGPGGQRGFASVHPGASGDPAEPGRTGTA